MTEVWKPIPEYEGLYEVSNMGRVRSLFRYKKILKPSPNWNGYATVELWKDHKRKRITIHRLVATCFCENPENKPFVNHLDETKTNNRADNLEWVTHIENCNYGTAIARRLEHTDYRNRRYSVEARERQLLAVSKPITQYTKDGKFIRAWASASECSKETGMSISGIRSVVNGKRNSIFGFVFTEGSGDLSHA